MWANTGSGDAARRSVVRLLIVAALCATPLVLHLAVVHESRLAMAVFMALLLLGLGYARAPRWHIVLGGAVAAVAINLDPATLGRIALAGPAVIFIVLAWVFGRTLLPGRTPLVEQISRVERGGDFPEGLRGYTRRLTLTWAALLAAVPATYALLATFGRVQAASFVINIAGHTLVVALFFGEYGYRLWRYPEYPHKNPFAVARNLLRRAPELLRERG